MRFLCALALASGLAAAALARPPADTPGPYAAWYEGLKQPRSGTSCCSIADCRHYRVRIRDGNYEVLFEGAWLIVPNEVILQHEDNPTGDYIACVIDNDFQHGIREPRVLCFIRAPGT
jgi:hypothetical protein